MVKINYKKYCDVNLKYLKDKFNLKKFLGQFKHKFADVE